MYMELNFLTKLFCAVNVMSLKGLTPCVATYSKDNKPAFAKHFFEVMKTNELQPNVVNWSSLLHGLCKAL